VVSKAVALYAVASDAAKGNTYLMPARSQSLQHLRACVASNVKHYRAIKGVSQERTALEAGIDRTMLSKIERGITNPSLDTLLKVANYLDVPVSELLKEDLSE
jgi:DNA-binding XRE family transcriptional regulator